MPVTPHGSKKNALHDFGPCPSSAYRVKMKDPLMRNPAYAPGLKDYWKSSVNSPGGLL